ncbi:MAG: sigma-54-dependent Fis family transcriptional regulator [Prevotella sp.]|nr:sigma-54-dependent Fis family transcriptional regulator [Prevotella sp.]MBQ3769909.1 sigma-54-dependent Fis family transcriptional regulator [Prevotella sp.]MBR0527747.1 sigma-54-dependent Fis family transcriptional regulator [Prevotella sp.]
MNRYKVLIVEDDDVMLRLAKNWMHDAKILSDSAQKVSEALKMIAANEYDAIVSDLLLPDGHGTKILEKLNENRIRTPFVMMTKVTDAPLAVNAMKMGAADYLIKPVHDIQLVDAVMKAIRNSPPKQKGHVIYERQSAAYQKMMRRVRIFASTDSTVLIYGESGAGKEHIAREIHYQSHRKDKPYITKDCAAIHTDIAMSVLFGHVKGAYTGATEETTGLIQTAEGGTLFLDEVENLPMAVQKMLLRVLEERVYQKMGSNKDIRCNIRLVVASNENLREKVSKGEFRKDLLARINEFPIEVPPLRLCREDILPLAEEFMKESCETNHLDVTGFSDEAVKKIMGYDWPENVRQLKHTIDRAVVLTRSGQIQADEIEIEDIVNVKNPLSLKNEEQEKEKIIKAIAMTSSYDEAAELLGITRETLFQKRKKYGLTKR